MEGFAEKRASGSNCANTSGGTSGAQSTSARVNGVERARWPRCLRRRRVSGVCVSVSSSRTCFKVCTKEDADCRV